MEACLELAGDPRVVAMQDLGAAGYTSSTAELAHRGGCGIAIRTRTKRGRHRQIAVAALKLGVAVVLAAGLCSVCGFFFFCCSLGRATWTVTRTIVVRFSCFFSFPSARRGRCAPTGRREEAREELFLELLPGSGHPSRPARLELPQVSFEEMLEMAASGAKVLQLRSVEYARTHGVRLHCRSSFDPGPGTFCPGRRRDDGTSAHNRCDSFHRRGADHPRRRTGPPRGRGVDLRRRGGGELNVDTIIQNEPSRKA